MIPFALVDRISASVFSDFLQPEPHLKQRSARRPSRRDRWRRWIATYALVALAWPSLGVLPWVAMDRAEPDEAAHESAHGDAALSPAAQHHHGDASDIPGSPTHPVDHDCFQCQVLKHLSRCVPSALDPPTIPWQPGCPVQPRGQLESQIAAHIAALPPARGPPLVIA